jgi:hypothetical protein
MNYTTINTVLYFSPSIYLPTDSSSLTWDKSKPFFFASATYLARVLREIDISVETRLRFCFSSETFLIAYLETSSKVTRNLSFFLIYRLTISDF